MDVVDSEGRETVPPLKIIVDGDGFDVLEGPPSLAETFPDTMHFLELLKSLEKEGTEADSPEIRAAANLFDWDSDFIICRSPGRLDVMGGIADYSGSLVLQMPIAEAAHVALQLQSPENQGGDMCHQQGAEAPLTSATAANDEQDARFNTVLRGFTKYFEMCSEADKGILLEKLLVIHKETVEEAEKCRQLKQKAHVPPGHLRIVSLNAEDKGSTRVPALDMELSGLLDPESGEPISYSAAREYFRKDPALSWAAYVAGALVVLMHESDLRPVDSISMLVSSAVPEGKGVSSSAALEVASMSALAAAHGVVLDGRRLALLCQKVENLVVGTIDGVSYLRRPSLLL